MKVIVGKMPGGRATEVEIPEGGTVLDAIKAAGYESDLNQGFEARMNNSQTELSSQVGENSIITLTSKITGNSGISAISVVPVATNAACERFVVLTPTIIHDFINLPDVKDMLLRLKKTVFPADVKCIVADPVNLKVSKPIDIVVYGTTVICTDFSSVIDAGNYVAFCNEATANKIYGMDSLSAVTYIEGYIPEESRNKDSLAMTTQIPEGAEEVEVCEEQTEGYNEDTEFPPKKKNEEACGECSVATEFEDYCGPKENNPCCDPSECCEDCQEDTCGQCSKDPDECCEEDCCNSLPEEYITVKELVDMCKRLGIDVNINIPGAYEHINRCHH